VRDNGGQLCCCVISPAIAEIFSINVKDRSVLKPYKGTLAVARVTFFDF